MCNENVYYSRKNGEESLFVCIWLCPLIEGIKRAQEHALCASQSPGAMQYAICRRDCHEASRPDSTRCSEHRVPPS